MVQNSIINDQTNVNLNRFLNDIRKYGPLTKVEETDLILAAQAGDIQVENAEANARLDDHEPSPEEIMECIHGLSEESAKMFRLLYGVNDALELACVKQMAQDTMHFASKGKIA